MHEVVNFESSWRHPVLVQGDPKTILHRLTPPLQFPIWFMTIGSEVLHLLPLFFHPLLCEAPHFTLQCTVAYECFINWDPENNTHTSPNKINLIPGCVWVLLIQVFKKTTFIRHTVGRMKKIGNKYRTS